MEGLLRLGGKLAVWVDAEEKVWAGPPDGEWKEQVAYIATNRLMGIPRLLYGVGFLQDVILNPSKADEVPEMVLNMIRNRAKVWEPHGD